MSADTAQLLSLAPQLEPLAGAGLALNLAYLNLKRFRYRENISVHARNMFLRILQKTESRFILETSMMKQLQDFSTLKRYDPVHDETPEGDQVIEPVNGKKDFSISRLIYRLIYEHHIDRGVSHIFSGICLFVLLAGVLNTVDRESWFHLWFNTPEEALFWLWLVFWGVSAPLITVVLGNFIVWRCKKIATHVDKELNSIMSRMAGDAELTGAPTGN